MRFVEQFGTGQGMGFHGFSDRRLVVTWLVLFPADMIWSNRGCFTNDHSQWFPLVKLNKGLFFFPDSLVSLLHLCAFTNCCVRQAH